jgi:hypothetical protein
MNDLLKKPGKKLSLSIENNVFLLGFFNSDKEYTFNLLSIPLLFPNNSEENNLARDLFVITIFVSKKIFQKGLPSFYFSN